MLEQWEEIFRELLFYSPEIVLLLKFLLKENSDTGKAHIYCKEV